MKNPGDQNVVAFLAIVDDVVFDCEGSHADTDLRTYTADPRLFGQQLESVEDVVNEPVRSCETGVLGDIGPDSPRRNVLRDDRPRAKPSGGTFITPMNPAVSSVRIISLT